MEKFKERFHHQNEASVYSEPKNDLGKTVWLKFEVTNEVTDEKIEKIQCFQGFPTSGRKSTASRLHVAHRSSPSAKFYSLYRQTAVWRYFYMLAAKAACSVYRAGGLYFCALDHTVSNCPDKCPSNGGFLRSVSRDPEGRDDNENAGRRACTKGTYRTGKPHNMNWGSSCVLSKTATASAQKQRRKP